MAVPSILQRILQRKSEEIAAGKAINSIADLAAQVTGLCATTGFRKRT